MATGDITPPSPAALEVLEVLLGVGRHHPYKKTDLGKTPGVAVTVSRQVFAGDVCTLYGWAVAETTGAASAAIRLRDGLDANAEVIARINLLASESDRDTFTPHGIIVSTGHLWLEVLSGSVEGVLFWR